MRILIAEDETLIRLDLRQLLEAAGFEICAEARDGEEAVELARREQPDLAVLDVKMPRLDGIEAAKRILEERPIPIVMVTAYGEQELVARAVEAELEPVSLAGDRATALALVFSELFQNALEHGGGTVRIRLARRGDDVALAVADDGAGLNGSGDGTGLSIVRALVRDELQGTIELTSEPGLRAEVLFPA